jgi:CRISPR-associated protein Cmr6
MNTRRTALQSVGFQDSSNASLWFDKYIKGQNSEGESDPFKRDLINDVTKIATSDIYKSFFERWKHSLSTTGAKFKNLGVSGRMIVGLGEESVLEASISLHRTYGVPFVGGSALKGLACSYADRKLEDESWRKGGRAHEFVFGSQASAGHITFHDALLIPDTQYPLHTDVMTVHHSEYYGDIKDEDGSPLPPADWDSPIPIPFLSASGNYLLAISGVESVEKWVEFVFLILGQALREEGVGAKTSSGYGRATLSELPPSEKEKSAANARLLESSVAQLVAEIRGIHDFGKEAKDKLKVIAVKHINKGNMPAECKRKLARAVIEKCEDLQLDLHTTEWFKQVTERSKI